MSDLTTTRARAWALTREDGTVLGFTDHDRDLSFEGLTFRAGTGMSASAITQGTGLAVDNTEASGALSDAALTEGDILAGLYDNAALVIWEVDWTDPDARRCACALRPGAGSGSARPIRPVAQRGPGRQRLARTAFSRASHRTWRAHNREPDYLRCRPRL